MALKIRLEKFFFIILVSIVISACSTQETGQGRQDAYKQVNSNNATNVLAMDSMVAKKNQNVNHANKINIIKDNSSVEDNDVFQDAENDQLGDATDEQVSDAHENVFKGTNLWDEMRSHMQFPDYSSQPDVQQQIAWFQNHQKYLDRVVNRAAPYIYYIYQQTQIRNLPAELSLLPVIESAFNPTAYSSAGASGLWQMIPSTASLFGVRINWWYDGRRDLVDSTKAALDYLNYLGGLFNHDWLLAIASYNCGERAVQLAVDNNKRMNADTSFWNLRLPKETEAYIPRLLAVAAIVRDPNRFGVSLIPISNVPYIKPVKINSQIDLNQAAKLANISLKTIRELNPGYLRWATDPDGKQVLMLPSDKAENFAQRLGNLAANERIVWRDHVVQSGESLKDIAQKYNTESSIIKNVNLLHDNYVRPTQRLLIPVNFHGGTQSLVVEQGKTFAKQNLPPPKINTPNKKHIYIYKVNRGDTIFSLATRFNSTPKLIRIANHLQNNNLHTGKIIRIPSSNNTRVVEGPKADQNKESDKLVKKSSHHIKRTTTILHKKVNHVVHQKKVSNKKINVSAHHHKKIKKKK